MTNREICESVIYSCEMAFEVYADNDEPLYWVVPAYITSFRTIALVDDAEEVWYVYVIPETNREDLEDFSAEEGMHIRGELEDAGFSVRDL